MIRIPMRTLTLVTSSLPLLGFIICVLISFFKDFEGVNYTHCRVYNFLPSISASIGGFTPQRYIWRVAVAFHTTPRFLFAFMYYNWHRQGTQNWNKNSKYRTLCQANLGVNLAELCCLLGLTYVSSEEDYKTHEKCFIFFVVFGFIYMVTTCCLCHMRKAPMIRRSRRLKHYAFIAFVLSICGFSYFFLRHNLYCEPYVYSMFAFCEYISVVSNIGFHATVAVDFRDTNIVISSLDNEPVNTHNGYLLR
ncbi:post-GPI attachment to proteins factor 2-like [Asterias amurensis]|uniref:post-GPI attachment to proteins factor 2-like n=1 Tax=Asterias amurensis TaxID=7602 RepID=UPI003AB3DD76